MSIPPPPGFNKTEPTPTVDADEVSFILDATLTHGHRNDPNVIRFISRYLICRHARQAARESGLEPQVGPVLLKRGDIYDAIRKITDKAVMKHGYDASEVVERVKEVVGVDPAELQNPDGSMVENLHQLSPETRRAIKKFKAKNIYEDDPNGMKRVVGKIIEVEFYDKMQGAQLLGREKDLFVEKKKVEHGLSADMRSVLLESKARAMQFQEELAQPKALPEPIDVTPVSAEAIAVEKIMREPDERS